jgi:hypothetical protein
MPLMPTCEHDHSDPDVPRLCAIESAARDVYKSALATNGKATMGEWARLGDALDGLATPAAAAETLRATLREARSSLISAERALAERGGWESLRAHLAEVIAECDAVLPANHPDAFSK